MVVQLEQLSPQRRTSTAAALRKGEIKISEPVPWEHSGHALVWNPPSPSHRQSQFPSIYNNISQPNLPRPTDSVTGFQAPAMVVGTGPPVNASKFQTGGPLPDASMPTPGDHTAATDAYNAPPPTAAMPEGPKPRRKTSSLFVKDSRDVAGPTPDSRHSHAPSHSQVSTNDSARDTPMDSPAKKKRRSGSIRGAFKRMFSKREKQGKPDQVRETPPSRGRARGHEYHSSEPCVFPASRGGLDKVTEEGRTSPAKHVQKQEAAEEQVRSRSPIGTPRLPFPMNIHGDQPATYNPGRSQTNLEPPAHPHRRRATLPSLVLSPSEAATLHRFWDRGSIVTPEPNIELNDRGRTPTPLIGLAITSNIASKRRSRSADALRNLTSQQENLSDIRRRSAEIQYWRSPEQRIQEIDESAQRSPRSQRASIQEATPHSKASTPTRAGSPVTAVEIPVVQEEAAQKRMAIIIQPPRSDSRHNHDEKEGHSTQKEGEPIIQVDQRLSQLELNMSQLERSMQAFSGRQTTEAFRLHKPPASRGRGTEDHESRDRHLGPPFNTRDATQLARSASMRHPPSPRVTHPRPSPSLHDINLRGEQPEEMERVPTAVPYDGSPLPTVQFNPRRYTRDAVTPPGQVHNFSTPYGTQKESPSQLVDQLAPLYAALQYERSIRKQLESTVMQLQRDLLNITNIIAEMRGLGAYPTPSPDHVLGMMTHHKVGHTDLPPELVHGDEDEDLLDEHPEYLASPTAWATPRENRDMSNEDWSSEMF